MLFKRRDRLTPMKFLGSFYKPWSAWKRTFVYIKHRILRLPHSTHDIAMGLASGCVVSWTPVFGFHILQCYIFCKVFRANFLAALLGTLFGNPWTFPILLWIAYIVGEFVTSHTGLDHFILLKTGGDVIENENIAVTAFFSTLVGGYLMAVVTFPLFYFGFYYFIEGARKAKNTVGGKVHNISQKRKSNRNDK